MEFRVLGPLEVVDGDRPVDLGGPRQRTLLGRLLVHANEVVAAERLIEDLWGEGSTGANALQVTVSRLRRALVAEDRLLTQPPGYLLRVAAGECDRDVFEQLVDEARRSIAHRKAQDAADTLRRALGLWRGQPFADFLYETFAQAEIARLEEARLACLEELVEADLALGHHAELVGELEALTREQPLRERPRGQLMLALYRSGRQADALELYRDTRELFADELGIEPGPALRRIEAAILRQDAELELPTTPVAVEAGKPAAPDPAAPAPAIRKTVTVLVTGAAASTAALDPEFRRRLGDRAFTEVAPVLERHGGTVERLLDGRLIAVYGVPATHEDDALRAVRAAVELRDAFAGRTDTVSIGIDSGEVLTGDTDSGEPLVTGSAVDAAAALQEASGAEILLGEMTRRLVRDAVRAEPLEIALGDFQAQAWRLLELVPGAPPFLRRFDAPLVGRDGELAQLRQAFERAMRERRAQLFTVFGEAGIGKSRLAAELARSLEWKARVLTGRCLSYGEGITYWPVREIVAQAAGGGEVQGLLGEDPDADAIVERLDSAVGTGTSGAVGEEVFWAVRKLAEALAQEQPLVLVFEDVHWAEPTLLDLIEHLADWVRRAPVLVVCLARPELLDGRPGWGGGKLNATSILLEPLSEEESSTLIGALSAGTELPPEASRRIADAAEGNPLFLEQMLAMLAESGEGLGEIVVPPAIQALLATRLDHLTPDERHLIERASVEGELFHVGGVVELSSPETPEAVGSQLMSLVRKELIRPELPTLPGHQAFGFRHALIRDAAYASLPKHARAELHHRYAAWLEHTLGDRAVEAEEFLGYHLEQAHRYRVELGIDEEATDVLAARAGGLLASAGRRAFGRGDTSAAVNLLERARTLLPTGSPTALELMPDLALALFQGGNPQRANPAADEALNAARAAGDRHAAARAAVTRSYCRYFFHLGRVDVDAMEREAEQALAVFNEMNDDLGQTRALYVLHAAAWSRGDADALAPGNERALESARRAGSRSDELETVGGFGAAMYWGSTPVPEARRRLLATRSKAGPGRSLEALTAVYLAIFDGMEGRFTEARQLMDQGRAELTELGVNWWGRIAVWLDVRLAMLADDAASAERCLREGLPSPDPMFELIARVELAWSVYVQGRDSEADALIQALAAMPAPVERAITIRRRALTARLLADRGRQAEAEHLIREAVALAEETNLLEIRGDTLIDLAEILRLSERPEEAASALEEAVGLYERKGNVVSAAKARALLDELR